MDTNIISILQNLIYTTYLAELLPFSMGLFFLKKINNHGVKVFFFYTLFLAVLLSLSLYFKFIQNDKAGQLIVNRFALVSEFILLSIYYYSFLQLRGKKILLIASSILFVAYSLYDYLITVNPLDFSYRPLVVECLFFALLIIYFFYEKLQYSVDTPILHTPEFWVSVAFLLYFSGNFFLFLFSTSMLKNPEFRTQYVIIYGTVTITKDILLAVAVLVHAYIGHLRNENREGSKPIKINLDSFYPTPNTNHNLQ